MDRRERRRRKRLAAKIEQGVILKKSPQPHTESPPPQSWVRQYFGKTISRTKLLYGLLGAVATFLSAYALFRPHVSVEPYVPLNPVDPYETQFVVRNENSIFEIHNVECVCWPRRMESGNGFSVISPVPLQNVRHTIPSLDPGDSSTVDCPPVIGGIGTYSGQVDFAELEIVVSYKQSWWPRAVAARYPFRAMRDVSKAVHWTHITPAEEKSIIQK